MKAKISFLILISTVLISVLAMIPSLQSLTTTSQAVAEELSEQESEGRLALIWSRLPESVRTRLSRSIELGWDDAITSRFTASQTINPQSPDWEANITVGRLEYIYLFVDRNFASLKTNLEVDDGLFYSADSMYFISYFIEIGNGTNPGDVTLVDTWIRGIVWGNDSDVSRAYYLLDWYSDIPNAPTDPHAYYDPKTGVFSIAFDPEEGPTSYSLDFAFLARKGHVNQFMLKPKVSHVVAPITKPALIPGSFYDMWITVKPFRVRGLPIRTEVYVEVPSWQSTENGVYVKNMDPQTTMYAFSGADPPDVPGPASGWGAWVYLNTWGIQQIDQLFPDHWIQVGFQKSDVTSGPNFGKFLYKGAILIYYFNKGFGIVMGNSPQLILSSEDWDISVTNGMGQDVLSILDYYFEEPKPTVIMSP